MKTIESFFPTRTVLKTHKHSH